MRVWVEYDPALGPLGQGRRRGPRPGSSATCRPRSSRFLQVGRRASARSIRSARATRRTPRGRAFTLGVGRLPRRGPRGRAPLLDGRDPRAAALEARARPARSSSPSRSPGASAPAGRPRRAPRRRRAVARSASPASIATTRTTAGRSVLDRELYLALFGDPRVTSVAVRRGAGRRTPTALRRRILARGRGALRPVDRDQPASCAARSSRSSTGPSPSRARSRRSRSPSPSLGIANALIASAVERRRSFGLLRAIGASRRTDPPAALLEALLCGLVAARPPPFAAGAAFACAPPRGDQPAVVRLDASCSRCPPVASPAPRRSCSPPRSSPGSFPGGIAASVDPAAALAEE